MWEGKDKRRAPRITTRFGAVYSFDRQEGQGFVANISYSGALLDNVSIRPQVSMPVHVHLLLPHRPNPLELVGQVVRHIERGFAIKYAEHNEDLRRFIDEPPPRADPTA